jgi:predicted small metal-binding protein
VKSFRCGDVVPGCSRSFTGSQDEVLLAVRAHARADHGLDEVPASVLDAVRGALVDV